MTTLAQGRNLAVDKGILTHASNRPQHPDMTQALDVRRRAPRIRSRIDVQRAIDGLWLRRSRLALQLMLLRTSQCRVTLNLITFVSRLMLSADYLRGIPERILYTYTFALFCA